MKYLCLVYSDERLLHSLPDSPEDAECLAYAESVQGSGRMLAAEALGRPHRVEGVVVRGDGRGRVLGFPTANVAPPMYSAIPADGVYAAWFTVLGHGPITGSVIPGGVSEFRAE